VQYFKPTFFEEPRASFRFAPRSNRRLIWRAVLAALILGAGAAAIDQWRDTAAQMLISAAPATQATMPLAVAGYAPHGAMPWSDIVGPSII
jgi:hypothetical protein